jgi:hypothetical protein
MWRRAVPPPAAPGRAAGAARRQLGRGGGRARCGRAGHERGAARGGARCRLDRGALARAPASRRRRAWPAASRAGPPLPLRAAPEAHVPFARSRPATERRPALAGRAPAANQAGRSPPPRPPRGRPDAAEPRNRGGGEARAPGVPLEREVWGARAVADTRARLAARPARPVRRRPDRRPAPAGGRAPCRGRSGPSRAPAASRRTVRGGPDRARFASQNARRGRPSRPLLPAPQARRPRPSTSAAMWPRASRRARARCAARRPPPLRACRLPPAACRRRRRRLPPPALLTPFRPRPRHQTARDDAVQKRLTTSAGVVQLYRYPGLTESRAATLLHKVGSGVGVGWGGAPHHLPAVNGAPGSPCSGLLTGAAAVCAAWGARRRRSRRIRSRRRSPSQPAAHRAGPPRPPAPAPTPKTGPVQGVRGDYLC